MDSVSAKPNMPFVRSYKTVSLSQLGNPQPVQTPEQPKEVVPKRTRQAYIPVAALPQAQTPAQSQPPQPAITPLSKNKRIASFNKPSLPPVQQVQQAQPVQSAQPIQPVKSSKHVIIRSVGKC